MRFLHVLMVAIVSLPATNVFAENQKFKCSVSGRRDSHWFYSGEAVGDNRFSACQKALDKCEAAQAVDCICGECTPLVTDCHRECRWINGHEPREVCTNVCHDRPAPDDHN